MPFSVNLSCSEQIGFSLVWLQITSLNCACSEFRQLRQAGSIHMDRERIDLNRPLHQVGPGPRPKRSTRLRTANVHFMHSSEPPHLVGVAT